MWVQPSQELDAFDRVVRMVVRQLDEAEALIDKAAFVKAYEDLFYLHAAQSIAPTETDAKYVSAEISRMLHHIADNLSEPLTVSEVALAGGVSVRVAQQAFQKHLNTTITATIRTERLKLARSLLTSGGGLTVTEVALASGFTHLSDFARSYKIAFGETPRETLLKAPR